MKTLEIKNQKLNTQLPVFYQSTLRNKNNPFQVSVINIKGKQATVRTHGETSVEFNCKISSLYNETY